MRIPNFLRSELKKRGWLIVFGMICAMTVGLLSSFLASLVGPILTLFISGDSEKNPLQSLAPHLRWLFEHLWNLQSLTTSSLLLALPLALISFSLAKSALSILVFFLWDLSAERIAFAIRRRLIDSFLLSESTTLGAEPNEEVQERNLAFCIGNDTQTIRFFVSGFMGIVPLELFQAILLAASAIMISPTLTLIMAAGVVPAAYAIRKIGKKIRNRTRVAVDHYSDLAEWLQQRLLGIETIKQLKTEQTEIGKMEISSQTILERFYRAAQTKARTSPIVETLAVCALALIIALGNRVLGHSSLQLETFLSFLAVAAFLGQSLNNLSKLLNTRNTSFAAMSRIDELLQSFERQSSRAAKSQKIEASPICLSDTTRIDFQKVSVRYPGATADTLTDLDFSLQGGSLVCILGASGSGKSTLFKTMLGLLPVRTGLMQRTIETQHNVPLLFMPQKPLLGPFSLAENIVYPEQKIDRTRVIDSCELASIGRILERFPRGIDEILSFDNATISGGEAQRIHLARLFYHRSPIILVDEGTSALDPENEGRILHGLRTIAHKNGALVIIVAHRLAVLDFADKCLLLENGRLLTSGTSQEIRASEGFQRYLGTVKPS